MALRDQVMGNGDGGYFFPNSGLYFGDEDEAKNWADQYEQNGWNNITSSLNHTARGAPGSSIITLDDGRLAVMGSDGSILQEQAKPDSGGGGLFGSDFGGGLGRLVDRTISGMSENPLRSALMIGGGMFASPLLAESLGIPMAAAAPMTQAALSIGTGGSISPLSLIASSAMNADFGDITGGGGGPDISNPGPMQVAANASDTMVDAADPMRYLKQSVDPIDVLRRVDEIGGGEGVQSGLKSLGYGSEGEALAAVNPDFAGPMAGRLSGDATAMIAPPIGGPSSTTDQQHIDPRALHPAIEGDGVDWNQLGNEWERASADTPTTDHAIEGGGGPTMSSDEGGGGFLDYLKAAPDWMEKHKLATMMGLGLGLGGLQLYGSKLAADRNAKSASDIRSDSLARRAQMDNPPVYAGLNLTGGLSRNAMPSSDSFRRYGRGPEYRFFSAKGGMPQDGSVHRMSPLQMVQGHGGGQDDTVPAMLSPSEYVMDADTVAALGDGNPEEGARRLDRMRESIRRHKRSAPAQKIPPKAKAPEAYLRRAA